MDADADNHGPERIMVNTADFKVQQVVVVQDTVIETLTGSALAVEGAVKRAVPWDTRMEAQAHIGADVDSTSIAAGRAGTGAWAFLYLAAFERAAVLLCTLAAVKAPAAHGEAALAERMPMLVQGDVLREPITGRSPWIDVDQRINAPAFQE